MDYNTCPFYEEDIENFGGCECLIGEEGPRCHGCPYSLERVKKVLEIAEAAEWWAECNDFLLDTQPKQFDATIELFAIHRKACADLKALIGGE